MANSVAILVFSGTGDTFAVARLIGSVLTGGGSAVEYFAIDDFLRGSKTFNPAGYDLIGLGYPSYGFNVPGIVTDYVKTLDGTAHNDVHAAYVWCERWMLRLTALDFHAGKLCTQCGLCVRDCPKGNIALKDGRIRFGANCAGCFRCVYRCPRRAIGARLCKAAVLKDWYDLEKIACDDSIPSDFVTKETKGLFRTLYGYLQQ